MFTIGLLLMVLGWCLDAKPGHAAISIRLILAGLGLIVFDLVLAGGLLLWYALRW